MTAPLPIGALRHRLTLERASLGADDAVTWSAVGTVFAAIDAVSAAEGEAGAGITGTVTHRLELRWRDDVTSRDRLVAGSRVFRILATHDLDGRRNRLVVRAEEESR